MVLLIALFVIFSFAATILVVAVCMQSSRFGREDSWEEEYTPAKKAEKRTIAQPKGAAEKPYRATLSAHSSDPIYPSNQTK